MKTFIAFRLRKELDADLIALGIDEDKLPDLCRNGLRLMLGIKTTKQMEIKETPIVTEAAQPTRTRPAARTLPGTGKVWTGGIKSESNNQRERAE